jgi:perosamine synthetase
VRGSRKRSEWRDGGFDVTYRNILPGLNYRMSNLQAAVGLAQIERFDALLKARLRNAELMQHYLDGKMAVCRRMRRP